MNIADIIADREAGTPGPWAHGKNIIFQNGETGPLRWIFETQWDDAQGKADIRRVLRLPDMEAALIALTAEIERLRGVIETVVMGFDVKTDMHWVINAAREALKGGAE